MKTIAHVLKTKGYNIWSISPDAPVFDAIRLMAEKEVGALLVLKDGKPAGVVSERDYARKVILKGRSSKETTVGEIMTPRVIFATPEQSVRDCMAVMTAKRVRHLPVLDGDRLVGMVSIGDLVRSVLADQEEVIHGLEAYILNHGDIA
jgi:CBS domain-containing protein